MSVFDFFRPKKLLREALKDKDFARIEKSSTTIRG